MKTRHETGISIREGHSSGDTPAPCEGNSEYRGAPALRPEQSRLNMSALRKGLLPVSYTHLDVYKRQVKKLCRVLKRVRPELQCSFKVLFRTPRNFRLQFATKSSERMNSRPRDLHFVHAFGRICENGRVPV